jgi:hypothetical protein
VPRQDDDDGSGKRNVACEFCHKRKAKCKGDGEKPCPTCVARGIQCVYPPPKKRGPKRGALKALQSRVRDLEHVLRKIGGSDVGKSSSRPSSDDDDDEDDDDEDGDDEDGDDYAHLPEAREPLVPPSLASEVRVPPAVSLRGGGRLHTAVEMYPPRAPDVPTVAGLAPNQVALQAALAVASNGSLTLPVKEMDTLLRQHSAPIAPLFEEARYVRAYFHFCNPQTPMVCKESFYRTGLLLCEWEGTEAVCLNEVPVCDHRLTSAAGCSCLTFVRATDVTKEMVYDIAERIGDELITIGMLDYPGPKDVATGRLYAAAPPKPQVAGDRPLTDPARLEAAVADPCGTLLSAHKYMPLCRALARTAAQITSQRASQSRDRRAFPSEQAVFKHRMSCAALKAAVLGIGAQLLDQQSRAELYMARARSAISVSFDQPSVEASSALLCLSYYHMGTSAMAGLSLGRCYLALAAEMSEFLAPRDPLDDFGLEDIRSMAIDQGLEGVAYAESAAASASSSSTGAASKPTGAASDTGVREPAKRPRSDEETVPEPKQARLDAAVGALRTNVGGWHTDVGSRLPLRLPGTAGGALTPPDVWVTALFLSRLTAIGGYRATHMELQALEDPASSGDESTPKKSPGGSSLVLQRHPRARLERALLVVSSAVRQRGRSQSHLEALAPSLFGLLEQAERVITTQRLGGQMSFTFQVAVDCLRSALYHATGDKSQALVFAERAIEGFRTERHIFADFATHRVLVMVLPVLLGCQRVELALEFVTWLESLTAKWPIAALLLAKTKRRIVHAGYGPRLEASAIDASMAAERARQSSIAVLSQAWPAGVGIDVAARELAAAAEREPAAFATEPASTSTIGLGNESAFRKSGSSRSSSFSAEAHPTAPLEKDPRVAGPMPSPSELITSPIIQTSALDGAWSAPHTSIGEFRGFSTTPVNPLTTPSLSPTGAFPAPQDAPVLQSSLSNATD